MSVEFLKKIYSELLEQKSELELEQNNIVIKLNENEKYIKRFRKEEEENYDAFSPRNQNQDLRKSIDTCEKKKITLLQRKENIEIKLKDIDEKIHGFDLLFQEEKKEKNFFEKNNRKQKKKLRKLQKNYWKDLSVIISKLEFCSQLIDVDPVRCKLELSSLIKMFYEKIDDNNSNEQEISEIC